jgi:hypothetical protein
MGCFYSVKERIQAIAGKQWKKEACGLRGSQKVALA